MRDFRSVGTGRNPPGFYPSTTFSDTKELPAPCPGAAMIPVAGSGRPAFNPYTPEPMHTASRHTGKE